MNIFAKHLLMLLQTDLCQVDCGSCGASAEVDEEDNLVVVHVRCHRFFLECGRLSGLDCEIIDVERRVIIVIALPSKLEGHRRDVLIGLHGHAAIISLGR